MIKMLYEKALELFRGNIVNQKRFFLKSNGELEKAAKCFDFCSCHENPCTCGYDKWQEQIRNADFELIALDTEDFYPFRRHREVKIMKKAIGFSFKLVKEDPDDLDRMQFVYDVCIACKNDKLLLPLAKKVKPNINKLLKKFGLSEAQKIEYQQLDIHDKEKVIDFINKIKN